MTFREQVIGHLRRIEPDYEQAVALGRRALRILAPIVESNGEGAVRAVHLAARLGGARGVAIVKTAARHSEDSLRIAAASTLDLLPEDAAVELFSFLIGDVRSDVAFQAVLSVERRRRPALAAALAAVASHHRARFVRHQARRALASLAAE